MILRVDASSPMPPYEQIRGQVASMVQAGVLAAGSRLPPIRQLAGDLGLAGGTVARAYRELEQDGIVVTRGRHGTVVADRPLRVDPTVRRARLADAARVYAATAHHTGADVGQAVAALRTAFERL
ncbi:MAG: GntR family transcriptional regulator [Acidimicrobiales bacterium]